MALDEFDLITRFFTRPPELAPAGFVSLGVGDDCALLLPSAGKVIATSTDTLVAGRHFSMDDAAFDIGWKTLAVNLSDLAACGAVPRAALLALTLPVADAGWLQGFADGFFALADHYGVVLAGGDTTQGPLSITVTVFGEVLPGEALRRDGARVGDLLCVTGTLGDAAAGLALKQQRLALPAQQALLARLHRPEPRLAAGHILAGVASSALDLSDGLAGDVRHIAEKSGVGFVIDADALPCSEALAALALSVAERLALQLSGGDDYELLFTLPAAQQYELQQRLADTGVSMTVIGQAVAEREIRLRYSDGSERLLREGGYRHFSGS